jgi:hypothetical protein
MRVRHFHPVLFFTVLWTSVLAAALSGGECLADDTPSEEKTSGGGQGEPKTEVVYEQKTVLDFSDVTLEGELVRPEGSYLLNRKKARFGSLVELRGDFVPELTRSLDNF